MKSSNYYGSDLNQFIDEYCSHQMICINIDCFLVKFKNDKSQIRFIESKHTSEGMKKGQNIALSLIKELTHPTCIIEVYLVRGEYPYTKATVEDMQGKSWELNQRDLILWLNFDIELDDIQKEFTNLGDMF